MCRWNGLFLAAVAAAALAACSSLASAPHIEPPDLIDQLSNADLRPAAARRSPAASARQTSGDDETPPLADTYPGDDRIAGERTKSAGIAKGLNGYELNFNDAELSELTKVILRDTLGLAYSYDPRVQGRVTLSTGGAVARDELLKILESTLAMNHGALIAEGNLYRIVPEAEGQQESVTSFDYAKERQEIGAGYGVSIVPLRYVAAETMMRMLDPLASKDQALRASIHNNLLIVRGTSKQRGSVLEIVSMFDVDWMKGQSAGIFTLKDAAPDDVIKELEQVFRTESQGKDLVRFKAISRLNAILAITQKSYFLKEVETWVSRLDRGDGEGEAYFVYRVENGRAKDLATLLTQAFSGGGGSVREAEETAVAPTEAVSQVGSLRNGKDGPAEGNGGGISREGASSGAQSAETPSAEPSAPASQDGAIRITPDERNNKLLIKASGRDLRKILDILRRIDQPPQQVLINATLAEVTLNDSLQYGVQFFFQKNGGHDGAIGFTNGSSLDITPAVPGLNFIVGNIASNPRIIIDALAKETAVRVVSSPSVVVLHNQTATLQVGDEIPYTTRQAQSVQNVDSPLVTEVQYKNTGVILKVTPRINSNGLVTMEIDQEISAVVNSATSTDTSLTPTISQRSIRSTIAVQSGQMVILGGLISEQVDREKSRIPVLGKIPYVGDVIGGSNDNLKQRTELVVFLRPSVIRDPQDASNIAEAVRASMQSLAPRPSAWDTQLETSARTAVK